MTDDAARFGQRVREVVQQQTAKLLLWTLSLYGFFKPLIYSLTLV